MQTAPRIAQIKPEVKDELSTTGDVFRKVNKWIEKQQQLSNDSHFIAAETKNINLFENVPLPENPEGVRGPKEKKRKIKSKAQLMQIENEELNRLRNKHKIKVSAGGKKKPPTGVVPELMETFSQIHRHYQLNGNLMNNLTICGYEDPTAIQMQGIPIMLEKSKNYSLMACAPTGSGKTVTFLVPIIRDILELRDRREKISALLLCPTRELAKQTYRECIRLTQGLPIKTKTLVNAHKLVDKVVMADILISTPNSVCYLLKGSPKEKKLREETKGEETESEEDEEMSNEEEEEKSSEEDNEEEVLPSKLNLSHLRWLVIDEADKLFEETKNSFRDQLDQIFGQCKSKRIRVALFSATYTKIVAGWCKRNLKNLIKITVGVRNSAAESVDQKLLFVGTEDGKLLSLRNLVSAGCQPPVLIFVQSKDRAQQLFQELAFDGINVDVMHSDRTQAERDQVVKDFRMGNTWFLICTELMSRGIDFKGVNLVINYDFPTSTISYVHRIGRTGRADRRGEAITFFTTEDTVNLREIAHVIRNSGSEVPEYMLTLKRRSKQVRRKLTKSAPKRAAITTTPGFERAQRAHRKQMIKHSKGKKREAEDKEQGDEQGKKRTKKEGN